MKYLFFSSLPTLIVNHFLSPISSTIFSKKTIITSQVSTQINLQTIQLGNKIHNHKKFLLFICIDCLNFFHRSIHCSSTQIIQKCFHHFLKQINSPFFAQSQRHHCTIAQPNHTLSHITIFSVTISIHKLSKFNVHLANPTT